MKNIQRFPESKVEEISSRYISGVDKFSRMYAGMASNLDRYENDIIYLRIENTGKQVPSNYKTALKTVKSWVRFNKELCETKGFVVSFFHTKSTGFMLSHEDMNNKDKIKQVVEELKSTREQKSELISIFSGLY